MNIFEKKYLRISSASFKNPLFYLLRRRRLKKACAKWNADIVPLINARADCAEADRTEILMWDCLVWQEIQMWILLGSRQVVKDEFDWICDRRGFTAEQREYLKEMMKHVGLSPE